MAIEEVFKTGEYKRGRVYVFLKDFWYIFWRLFLAVSYGWLAVVISYCIITGSLTWPWYETNFFLLSRAESVIIFWISFTISGWGNKASWEAENKQI